MLIAKQIAPRVLFLLDLTIRISYTYFEKKKRKKNKCLSQIGSDIRERFCRCSACSICVVHYIPGECGPNTKQIPRLKYSLYNIGDIFQIKLWLLGAGYLVFRSYLISANNMHSWLCTFLQTNHPKIVYQKW